MGNLLVSHLMKSESKVPLHYPPPLKASEANLPEFPGHVISSEVQNCRNLSLETDMVAGKKCYLLPVKNSINEVRHERNVVRIKVVISKQELKEMVRKGGVDQMLSRLLQKESNKFGGTGDTDCCKGWKPILESIPEGNDSLTKQHLFCPSSSLGKQKQIS